MAQAAPGCQIAPDTISPFDHASFRDQDLAQNYRDLRPDFFEANAFREWFEGEHNDWILYCSGEPRCGKTTFAAAIARHIREQKQTSTSISIFLGLRDGHGSAAWGPFNDVTRSTSEVVLRAILRQLLESQHGPSRALTVTTSTVDAWSIDELRSHVCKALGGPQHAFIIFDALDECPESVQIELHELISALRPYAKIACTGLPLDQVRSQSIACSANTCNQSGSLLLSWWYCEECDWHICWPCHKLGRHCCDSTHKMQQPPFYVQISLAVDSSEIEKYLDEALQDFPQLDSAIIDNLVDTILQISGGSFSLVSLIVNQLNKKNLEDLMEVSDRLPNYQIRNFNFFFAELEDQQPSNARLAEKAIMLVAGSLEAPFRPLTLDELVSAIDFVNSESLMFKTEVTRPRVLQATRGFLALNGQGVVDFAHSSLSEFVGNEWQHRQDSSHVLRDLCLKALSGEQGLMAQVGEHPRKLLKNPNSRLPFLQYALGNLGACLDRGLSDSLKSTTQLLESHFHSNLELGLAQLAMDRSSWAGSDKLHLLPLFDSIDVLEHYIRESPEELNVQDHLTGDTLAMLACDQCNYELVQVLLGSRDKVDFTLKCRKGNTAFWRAVNNGEGQTELIQLLLEGLDGDALNARCENNKTALMLAIEEDALDDETFATLAKHADIDLKVQDTHGRTAVHAAAGALGRNPAYLMSVAKHPRFHEVTHLPDHAGCNALMLVAGSNAPQEQRREMLHLLLSNGAKVSSTDNDGRTVLHYAAATRFSRRVSQFLLSKKGMTAQAKDNHGRTPLHVAVDTGASDTSLQFLQEHGSGASLPKWKKEFVDRLQSLELDPVEIAEVDVTARDSSRNTVLHLATEHTEDPSVVQQILAEPGLDINATNAEGRTALHVALRRLENAIQIFGRGERNDDKEAEDVEVPVQPPPFKALLSNIFTILDDERTGKIISIRDHTGKMPIDFARYIGNCPQARKERNKQLGKPSNFTNVLFKLIDVGADMSHVSHRLIQAWFEWAIQEASLKGNTWPNVIQRLVDAGADVLLRIPLLKDKLPWQSIPVSRSKDHKEISTILERKEVEIFKHMRNAHKARPKKKRVNDTAAKSISLVERGEHT